MDSESEPCEDCQQAHRRTAAVAVVVGCAIGLVAAAGAPMLVQLLREGVTRG